LKKISVTAVLILALFFLPACAAQSGGEADLAGFFQSLNETYTLPEMMEADEETIDGYYPGLNEITFVQKVVEIPKITSSVCEFVFVQCEDEKDTAAVEAILQARIDGQASGGAWYPATMAAWEKAEVIVSGDYVAMISAGDDTAEIAADWNALFD